VLELFGGSGTTLMAAEQLGRRCVATELDPKFCAVILERLSAAGLTATKLHGPQ
jgi:DNA modification methylase